MNVTVEPKTREQKYEDFNDMLKLIEKSEVHKKYTFNFLRERFLVAIEKNQYKVYRKDGKPVAAINWAWLSDEKSKEYEGRNFELKPEDWNAGKNLWVMEILTGKGMIPEIPIDISKMLPKGGHVNFFLFNEKTKELDLRQLRTGNDAVIVP